MSQLHHINEISNLAITNRSNISYQRIYLHCDVFNSAKFAITPLDVNIQSPNCQLTSFVPFMRRMDSVAINKTRSIKNPSIRSRTS